MPPSLGRGFCLPFLTCSLLFSLWSGLFCCWCLIPMEWKKDTGVKEKVLFWCESYGKLESIELYIGNKLTVRGSVWSSGGKRELRWEGRGGWWWLWLSRGMREFSRAGNIFIGKIGLGKPQWAVAEGRLLCLTSEMLEGSQHSLLVGWRLSWANKGWEGVWSLTWK